MRVLLSAYACEPNKGSEPGIGWAWANALADHGVDVWVLTRANNRPAIERALLGKTGKRPTFIYYDLPRWVRWFKKGSRGVRSYYYLWQIGAASAAKKAHENYKFDLVHHLTFGVVRLPSLMPRLGIPFVFGPLGGGESAPWKLRWTAYGWRGVVADLLRDVGNWLVWVDPFMHYAFSKAHVIYVKTPESLRTLPKPYRQKAKVRLELLAEKDTLVGCQPSVSQAQDRLRILYVGRLIYWKGAQLVLRAFANLTAERPEATLTIVGEGKEKPRLVALAAKLGIESQIYWHAPVPRKEVWSLYSSHDLFLYPSLHDSSGNVVLEAILSGLPVVCLQLGGPSEIVSATAGVLVAPGTAESCTRDLSQRLTSLYDSPSLRRELGSQGKTKAIAQYGVEIAVASMYAEYTRLIQRKR